MMDALQKTKALKRLDIPLDQLVPNPLNPNTMSDAQFNMLCSNFESVGFVDPLFVRQLPDGKYKVIGGHHRLEVAKLYGFDTAPCTVIDDPNFTADEEAFQTVRMNVIRGRMSPDKFFKLYESLTEKYADEVMADAFGFAEEEEFQKLIRQMSKTLPKDMQGQFQEAAKEIKTINGLSALLNSMFSKYGDTLETGYMIIDYGGKDSIWVRVSHKTFKAASALGQSAAEKGVTMDQVMEKLLDHGQTVLQSIALKGNAQD